MVSHGRIFSTSVVPRTLQGLDSKLFDGELAPVDFGAVRMQIAQLQQIASLAQNSPSHLTRFVAAQEALATLRELVGAEAFEHLSREPDSVVVPIPFTVTMPEDPPMQGAVLCAGMEGIGSDSVRGIAPAILAAAGCDDVGAASLSGYLHSAGIPLPCTVEIETGAVFRLIKIGGHGDYGLYALESMLDAVGTTAFVTQAWREHARDKRTIIYAVSESHADRIVAALRKVGARAKHVRIVGTLNAARGVAKQFNEGELDVLVSVEPLGPWSEHLDAQAMINVRPTRRRSLYLDMIKPILKPGSASRDEETIAVDIVGMPDPEDGCITFGSLMALEDEEHVPAMPFTRRLVEILRKKYKGNVEAMAADLGIGADALTRRLVGGIRGSVGKVMRVEFSHAEAIGSSPDELSRLYSESKKLVRPPEGKQYRVASAVLAWHGMDPATRQTLYEHLKEADLTRQNVIAYLCNDAHDDDERRWVLEVIRKEGMTKVISLYEHLADQLKRHIEAGGMYITSPAAVLQDLIQQLKESNTRVQINLSDPLIAEIYADATVREMVSEVHLHKLFVREGGVVFGDAMPPLWGEGISLPEAFVALGCSRDDVADWYEAVSALVPGVDERLKGVMIQRFMEIADRILSSNSYEGHRDALVAATGLTAEQVEEWINAAATYIREKGLLVHQTGGLQRIFGSRPQGSHALSILLEFFDPSAGKPFAVVLEEKLGLSVVQAYDRMRMWRAREERYPWGTRYARTDQCADKLEVMLASAEAEDPAGDGLPAFDDTLRARRLFPAKVYEWLPKLVVSYLESDGASALGDREDHYRRWTRLIAKHTKDSARGELVDRLIVALRSEAGNEHLFDARLMERRKLIKRAMVTLERKQVALGRQYHEYRAQLIALRRRMWDGSAHDDIVREVAAVEARAEEAEHESPAAQLARITNQDATKAPLAVFHELLDGADVSESVDELLYDEIEQLEDYEGPLERRHLVRIKNIFSRHLGADVVDAALEKADIVIE